MKRPGGEQRLQAVAEYGRRHYSIDKHCEQVASLALMLFDQLQAVLAMAGDDRFLLNCAALLHDIGWNDGQRGHHKRAAGMILKDQSLPLDSRERQLVAAVARYHRKALPHCGHRVFASLPQDQRQRVRRLAGILRLADGLDRSHGSIIRDVRCEKTDDRLLVTCYAGGPADDELTYGQKKAQLLSEVLGLPVEVRIMISI